MASLKAAKGARLSAAEIAAAHATFKRRWDQMESHAASMEIFREWQNEVGCPSDAAELKPYRPRFGGGCRSTAISCEEFWRYFKSYGWPSDDAVAHGFEHERPASSAIVSFADCAEFQLWGWDRAPRNINFADVGNRAQYDIVEASLCNVLEWLGKDVAESGQLTLQVHGLPIAPFLRRRTVFAIGGVCWSPKANRLSTCTHAEAPSSSMCFSNYRWLVVAFWPHVCYSPHQ